MGRPPEAPRDESLMRQDAESAIRTCERAWERDEKAIVTVGAGFLHLLATDVLSLLAAAGGETPAATVKTVEGFPPGSAPYEAVRAAESPPEGTKP